MLHKPSDVETGWTEERIATLKKLWGQGLTATQVAAEMGSGFSRSAVIGKVHRLKLPARLSPTTTRRERAAAGKALAAATRGTKPLGRPRRVGVDAQTFDVEPLPEEELGNDVTHLVGIMDLTRDTCRWPHGDPLLPGFGFCGKQPQAASQYCPAHSERAGASYGRGARL